jgi:hypothetical protein
VAFDRHFSTCLFQFLFSSRRAPHVLQLFAFFFFSIFIRRRPIRAKTKPFSTRFSTRFIFVRRVRILLSGGQRFSFALYLGCDIVGRCDARLFRDPRYFRRPQQRTANRRQLRWAREAPSCLRAVLRNRSNYRMAQSGIVSSMLGAVYFFAYVVVVARKMETAF